MLCADEKSQIQAFERSQLIFPLLPGVPERSTHDSIIAMNYVGGI